MKSPYYVATVTNAYRRRIDGILRGDASSDDIAALQAELNAASHRPYASGFYFGEMKRHASDDGTYLQDCVFVGVVREVLPDGRIRVEQRNRICAGDVIEVLSPNRLGLRFTAACMTAPDGAPMDAAVRPMELFDMNAPKGVAIGDLLRIRKA